MAVELGGDVTRRINTHHTTVIDTIIIIDSSSIVEVARRAGPSRSRS